MPVGDAFSDISLDQAGELGLGTPAAAPPLSFLDKVKLGDKQGGAGLDWGLNEMNWRNQALGEVQSALRKKGVEPVNPFAPVRQRPGETPVQAVDRRWGELFDQVQHVRAGDQTFLGDYAAVMDRASFDRLIAERRAASLAAVDRAAPDGLGGAGFLGNVLHGFKDPTSYIPVGAASREGLTFGQALLRTTIREATANVGFTAATEPLVQLDAQRMGQHRGLTDFLFDVGTSAVAGGAIGGTFEFGRGAPRAAGERFFPQTMRQYDADAFGKALGREIDRADLPGASPFRAFDPTVARIFGDMVPREQRTPDEQAALDAIERDTETKATSPFLPGPEGDDHHVKWLDTAMRAMTAPEPGSRLAVKPVAREAIADGTADASTARFPGRETVKAKIGLAEGEGPNRMGSGAAYHYQFTPRTWVALFKRRYPNDPRGFDEIAALRANPHLRDVMINDLIAENSAALRHAGFDGEDARNLYLAHVLGSDKAVRVLRARGEARLGDLLPESYFAKNPFKADWTANQMRAWADKRMGGTGAIEYAGQTAHAPEEAPDALPIPTGRYDVDAMFHFGGIEGDRPVLDPAHFGSSEEHAAAQVRFERERDAMEGYTPVATADELFNPYEHFDALKGYAAQRGTVTAEAMGEALGISPEQVRRAVGAMAAMDAKSPYMLSRGRAEVIDPVSGKTLRTGTEAGRIIRRPPRPGSTMGPESMLEFISRHGGLTDTGGDLKSMGADQFHQAKPFRRKLVNPEGLSQDDAFTMAIDAGFFPELAAEKFDAAHLPDLSIFHEAIDEELRGRPRYTPGDAVAATERDHRLYGQEPEPDHAASTEPLDRERMLQRVGHNYEPIIDAAIRRGIEVPDDMLVDASDLIDAGMHPDEALDNAALASAYRNLDAAAAETGNSTYAIDPDERFANDGFPEQRGIDDGDLAPVGGDRRPQGGAPDQGQAGTRLAELANDPARGDFGDPSGVAADTQADSLIHDLKMSTGARGTLEEFNAEGNERFLTFTSPEGDIANIHLTLNPDGRAEISVDPFSTNPHRFGPSTIRAAARQMRELYPEIKSFFGERQSGANPGRVQHVDASPLNVDEPTYRLDETGGESDLASILDEIDQAQKAATEMRNCLRPKGGDE